MQESKVTGQMKLEYKKTLVKFMFKMLSKADIFQYWSKKKSKLKDIEK